jgi:sugar phosphate isomerase/epimerase
MSEDSMNNKILTSNHILAGMPVHDAVLKLKEVGYDGIEVWSEGFFAQEEKGITSLAKVKSALKQSGLVSTVHTSIKDPQGNKYNIASKDIKLRKDSVKAVLDSISLAKSLGAVLINIHPGYSDTETYDEEYYSINMESLKAICDFARKKGVTVSMEIMEERPGEFIKTPQDVIDIIHKLNIDNLGMTLDIVHGYTHGRSEVERYLREIHKDIDHVFHCHVSGHSRYARHVPFSCCEIKDFWRAEIKHFLKFYHGTISIEGAKKPNKHIPMEMSEEDIVKDNILFVRAIM